MNILVVGCGRVGCSLVLLLEKLGHAVSVVDELSQNIDKLHEMTDDHIGGMTVIGVPIDIDVLRSAGIESCDAIAAVTPDDNINIMVGQVAETIFHVPRIITRVTDPSRKEVFSQRFGMRAICSTNLTVHAMLAGLLSDDAPDNHSITIGSSSANFLSFPIPKAYVGRMLSTLKAPQENLYLYGILRANNTMELAGKEDLMIRSDDAVIYSELAD